jgi:hypothetical protein
MAPAKKKLLRSGGRAIAATRWDLAKGAIEFGTDPRTLLKKLEQARQYPDSRRTYSIRQFTAALYDTQYENRSRLIEAQAEKLAIQNALRRRDLIPSVEVAEFAHAVAVELRPVILGMSAPDSDKQSLFRVLTSFEDGHLLVGRPTRRGRKKA